MTTRRDTQGLLEKSRRRLYLELPGGILEFIDADVILHLWSFIRNHRSGI